MKKYGKLFCVLSVTVIFSLMLAVFSGCASEIPFPEPDTAPDAPVNISLSDILSDKISSEGLYKDDIGNIYNYRYHVPELLIDSPDAQDINKQIEDVLLPEVTQEHKNMEESFSLIVYECGYAAYLNGSALSLILYTHTDFGYSEYMAFNIDAVTGKKLSNDELLKIKGYDSEYFLQLQKNALERGFLNLCGVVEGSEENSIYNDAYSATISDSNVSADCPIYLGPDSELRFIGKIYSLGGADYYNYLLSADNAESLFVTEIQTEI